MKKIGFIGIGKLGLDCAEVMAEKHEVRGYDVNPNVSQILGSRIAPYIEQEFPEYFVGFHSPSLGRSNRKY